MKIQELPVLAFITKLFLEGKAGINLVFEAWGVWGPVVCFTCWFPSAFWGKQRWGKAGKNLNALCSLPTLDRQKMDLFFSVGLQGAGFAQPEPQHP